MKYEDKKLIDGIVSFIYWNIIIRTIFAFIVLFGIGIVKALLYLK